MSKSSNVNLTSLEPQSQKPVMTKYLLVLQRLVLHMTSYALIAIKNAGTLHHKMLNGNALFTSEIQER